MKRAGTTHATVIAYLALLIALSGTAVAATGGTLRLGMVNKADETTVIQSRTGSALALRSEAGAPPLRVNSGAKVAQLNADQLDSLDASELQRRVTGTCEPGSSVQSISADGSVTCGAETPPTSISGTCEEGSFIRSISADGSVACGAQTPPTSISGTCEEGSPAAPDGRIPSYNDSGCRRDARGWPSRSEFDLASGRGRSRSGSDYVGWWRSRVVVAWCVRVPWA